MAEIYDYVVPYPVLSARDSMGRARAQRNAALSGDSVYERGDLVEVDASGQLQKCTQTVPASIGRLGFAATDFDLSPLDATRHAYQTTRGEPIEVLPREHTVVLTFQGATANGSNHQFTEADADAVRQQAQREIVFNGTEKVLTIRAGTTNPNVRLKRVHEGEVGDSNVRVEVSLLDAFRMERQ